ncbi:MAG: hypothetical protein HQM08_20155 [Candidatus Riflebacteria bacterium]|nr:hypothetical protein [Candidatus Riflebacteria bacterium]
MRHLILKKLSRNGNSALRTVLAFGSLTFFLLPFIQLWSVHDVPLFFSDSHRQAAMAVENLLSEALSKPFIEIMPKTEFHPISFPGDTPFEGKVEAFPHPNLPDITVVRAQVQWGMLFFRKQVVLEAMVSQTRP